MTQPKKKFPLYLKIVIGMVLGMVWGIFSSDFSGGSIFTLHYIKPFGTVFINLLKLIAIPIILSSLISGIASLKDLHKLGQIGGKTILLFICTALIATTLGVSMGNLLGPGKGFSQETRDLLVSQYASSTEKTIGRAIEHKEAGPLAILVNMTPDNILKAASDNINMLQVVFFALIFGIAIVKTPYEKAAPIIAFFESLNEVLIKLVGMIMQFAPFGVFALMASVLTDIASDAAYEFLLSLLSYAITVIITLMIMLFIVYPAIFILFSKIKYKQFFKGMQPALLLGFSTSSSSATLPVTIERVEKHLNVPEHISRFVLPFGTTINMDGTALYQSIAVVFVAQVLGIDLSFFQMITIVLTATLAATGAAGVPGAGMVTLVIVLESVGIPATIGIALITPPDRILDMCRTVVNVAGDAVAAIIIAHAEDTTSTKKT